MLMNDGRRRTAGNKRVAKALQVRDVWASSSGNNEVSNSGGNYGKMIFQSITASPGLDCVSFEELRVDCYRRSYAADGTTPRLVNFFVSPEEVIPPRFDLFVFDEEDEEDADLFLSEVIMFD